MSGNNPTQPHTIISNHAEIPRLNRTDMQNVALLLLSTAMVIDNSNVNLMNKASKLLSCG